MTGGRRGRGRKRDPPPQQKQPERKRNLSPTRLCRRSRYLSHRRWRNLPPDCTCCVPCLNSQRLEELESWNKILHEEIETRMMELDIIADVLLTSVEVLNIEFRLEEINRMTAFNFNALMKNKAHINTENAEKAKALKQNESVENLYDDKQESLNKKLEEQRLNKKTLRRDIAKIPKQSKFFRDARKKKKEQ